MFYCFTAISYVTFRSMAALNTLYTYSLDSHGCCYRQIFCYCEISRGGDFYA